MQKTPPVLTDRGPLRPGEQITALMLTEERSCIDKMLIYTLLLHLSANMLPAAGTSRYQLWAVFW